MMKPSTHQGMLGQVHEAVHCTLDNLTAKTIMLQRSKTYIYIVQSKLKYDWYIIGTSLLVVFFFTYVITSIKSNYAIRRKKYLRTPPIDPYWIPFIGNLFSFTWDPAGFCQRTTEKYGYSTPVRIRLGPFKMFLVSGAEQYITLFNNKASRNLNTKGAVLLALKNLFGTPAKVIPFYAADNSGVNATPAPGSNVLPHHRITYFQTRAAHKYLSGPALAQMTENFLSVLQRHLNQSQVSNEWVDHPDLYSFLQDNVFRAAVEALCGSHLLSQSPTFVQDFWDFTSSVPLLITGVPYIFAPKTYNRRKRLLNAVKKWHKFAHENSDCTKTGPEDPEWEPFFGSKLIRARQAYSMGMEAMSEDALASEDLGLLFATNTNSIPSLTWFIYEIVRSPALLARVLHSVSSSLDPTTNKLNITTLCADPLLQSIYAETLRLRVALFITRTPENKDFEIGEWKFPPGIDIALSSRTAAMNPNIWNQGTTADPHPLDSFWADRFLVYPNDPTSGPMKKSHLPIDEKVMVGQGLDRGEPSFSMQGVAGGWIPYGGGQRMCPGRHFAKQEIIGTLALLLLNFEVRLSEGGKKPESDMRFFPFGGLPPTRDIGFSIRRRQGPLVSLAEEGQEGRIR